MKEPRDITLLRQLIRLQGNPLDLAHPDRVTQLLAPFNPDHLRKCPAAWNRLGRVAAKTWGLEPCAWNPQESELAPFLLATPEQTNQICQWLGTLAAYQQIRKTIRGDVIRQLHEKLPDCFPAVYRQAQNFAPWKQDLNKAWTKDQELTPETITDGGRQILITMLSQEIPADIMKRWRLQFPEETDTAPPPQTLKIQNSLQLLLELNHRGLILC